MYQWIMRSWWTPVHLTRVKQQLRHIPLSRDPFAPQFIPPISPFGYSLHACAPFVRVLKLEELMYFPHFLVKLRLDLSVSGSEMLQKVAGSSGGQPS